VLTISLSEAGDSAVVGVESNGIIDFGLIPVPGKIIPPFTPIDYQQAGVESIVVRDASAGGDAPNQRVSFNSGVVKLINITGTPITSFSQNITTINIETVDIDNRVLGTVTGNATSVNVGGSGTIQNGVDFAAAGATVNVAGGTYTELVTVNKTLTLEGNNAGVDARTRLANNGLGGLGPITGAKPETIVNGSTGAFVLEADNIVLDGFTVENTTSVGILTSASFSGYQIRDDIIENNNNNIISAQQTNNIGLSLGSNGTSQTVVEQTWFLSNGTALNVNQMLSNALIQNNNISGSQTGINLSGASGQLTNITITNNNFLDGNNLQLTNVTNSTISGNQFSGSEPPRYYSPPPENGIYLPIVTNETLPTGTAVVLGGGDANLTVTGNTFTDRGWQDIQVADLNLGFGANSNISIIDNTLKQNVGLLAGATTAAMIDLNGVEGTATVSGNIVSLSGQIPNTFPPLRPSTVYGLEIEGTTTATVNITNNQVDGKNFEISNGTSAAVYLSSTLPATAVINIQNNYLNGFRYGVYGNALPSGTQVHVNFNDLTGNSGAAIVNDAPMIDVPQIIAGTGSPPTFPVQPPPDIFDLEDNWWGVTSAMAIAKLISGNPAPTTWLTSGLDTEPNVTGFQPDLALIFNGSTTADQAPSLTSIPDQNRSRNQGPITLTLSATDSGGNAVTYGAFLPSQVAYELHQELQLSLAPGGLFTNYFGKGENWLTGVTNQFGNDWYFIMPSGQLYAWDGTQKAGGAQVGTLTSTYAKNPSLLYDPVPPPPVQVSVTGNMLTVDPGTYVGNFEVVVEASDGQATCTTSFNVTISNQPPSITQTPDQTMASGQNQLVLPITATNPDNVALTYSALAGNMGYIFKQQYNLSLPGSLNLNYGGTQEIWLKGNTNQYGNSWYFLQPDGHFFAWNGTANKATGTSLANLDPIFYTRPDLIYNAQDQSLAYVLNQTLNLTFTGNYHQNYGGAGEKWLSGNVNQYGNSWYYITPSGQLYAWSGTLNQASGNLLANLDAINYSEPQLLYAAQVNALSVAMTGNMLTINRTPGYLGSFDVLVQVSDGLSTKTERFHVTAN